jgi:hypothetical protein
MVKCRHAVVGSGVAPGVRLGLAGCDPGPSDSFGVAIVNDGTQPLQFLQCVGGGVHTCARTESAGLLKPGESFTAQAGTDADNPWLVRTSAGKVVGCLPLHFTSYPKHKPRVATSTAQPCGALLG